MRFLKSFSNICDQLIRSKTTFIDLTLCIADSLAFKASDDLQMLMMTLPRDIQQEIWKKYELKTERENTQTRKPKTNIILNSFVK